MKCGNCDRPALYEYRITQKISQFYCGAHLPAFLEPRRRAGTLKLTPAHDVEKDAALQILGVKPPAEPIPTPKPTRKRKSKNATNS